MSEGGEKRGEDETRGIERRFGELFGGRGRRFRLRRPCLLINNTISPVSSRVSQFFSSDPPSLSGPPRPSLLLLLLHAAVQG